MSDDSKTPWLAADSSAVSLISQLVEVWDALIVVGHEISDADWAKPTPCPGWDVAAQYAHVIGTESMLLSRPSPDVEAGRPEHVRNDIGEFNEAWVVALAGQPREEVLAQLAEVTAARRAALSQMTEDDFQAPAWTPIGQADYRRFMQIRVFDLWVHEQDVRDAVGRPGHLDGQVAEQSVDEIMRAIGFIVGKKAGAPAGSSVLIRLTGPVEREVIVSVVDGRARPVVGLAGDPTATLELASGTFTRLACGRIDPAQAIERGASGGVVLAGDTELARQVAENLAFTI
jgi:uncharacterized protein (TIGR03083 family)